MMDFEALAAPFPSDKISWRVGSTNKKSAQSDDDLRGIGLAYIDARDVMERLDEVCGPANWQDTYSHADKRVICNLSIRCDGEWITKANGAGDTQVEADKGAISDAFKRAAVQWGVGRYLYSIENAWVKINKYGRILDDQKSILNKAHEKAANLIEWGTPAERVMLKAYLHTLRNQCQTPDDVRRFREANSGMIAQFRVKARELVEESLEKVSDAVNAKAA